MYNFSLSFFLSLVLLCFVVELLRIKTDVHAMLESTKIIILKCWDIPSFHNALSWNLLVNVIYVGRYANKKESVNSVSSVEKRTFMN